MKYLRRIKKTWRNTKLNIPLNSGPGVTGRALGALWISALFICVLASCGIGPPEKEFSSRRGYQHSEKIHCGNVDDSGRKTGFWFSYRSDSTLYRIERYHQGELQGWQYTFYDSGQLQLKVRYRAGKKHGRQYSYDPDGRHGSKMRFRNGDMVRSHIFTLEFPEAP